MALFRRPFADGSGPGLEFYCLGFAAQAPKMKSEFFETQHQPGVHWTQRMFIDGSRAEERCLGFFYFSDCAVHQRKIVVMVIRQGHVQIVWA